MLALPHFPSHFKTPATRTPLPFCLTEDFVSTGRERLHSASTAVQAIHSIRLNHGDRHGNSPAKPASPLVIISVVRFVDEAFADKCKSTNSLLVAIEHHQIDSYSDDRDNNAYDHSYKEEYNHK
jgi:hypothetical protein